MDVKSLAEWLDVAGDEKAASVIALAPEGVRTVVEIGSGTGAVLAALDRRGFGEEYWAVEPSAELVAEMPSLERLVATEVATFAEAFAGLTFDLAILSHVVEHLLAPAVLVEQALRRARYVIVEVPLEASIAGRARAAVRGRRDDETGHVQFFSRATARALISHSGGKVEAERGYFPLAPYRAQATKPHQRAVLVIARVPRFAQLYYEHFAMRACAVQVGDWHHPFAKPQ